MCPFAASSVGSPIFGMETQGPSRSHDHCAIPLTLSHSTEHRCATGYPTCHSRPTPCPKLRTSVGHERPTKKVPRTTPWPPVQTRKAWACGAISSQIHLFFCGGCDSWAACFQIRANDACHIWANAFKKVPLNLPENTPDRQQSFWLTQPHTKPHQPTSAAPPSPSPPPPPRHTMPPLPFAKASHCPDHSGTCMGHTPCQEMFRIGSPHRLPSLQPSCHVVSAKVVTCGAPGLGPPPLHNKRSSAVPQGARPSPPAIIQLRPTFRYVFCGVDGGRCALCPVKQGSALGTRSPPLIRQSPLFFHETPLR